MAYQNTYPAYGAYGGAPAYAPPPRKKRGLKRIIFGILGILANIVGLVLWPIVTGLIGAVIAAMGLFNLTPLDNGGSFELSSANTAMIYVAQDETVSAPQCDIATTSADASVDKQTDGTTVEHEGTTYTAVAQVTATEKTTVAVQCAGADKIAYGTGDMTIMLILGGIGVLIPIVFGVLALILLIWGIIARVRS